MPSARKQRPLSQRAVQEHAPHQTDLEACGQPKQMAVAVRNKGRLQIISANADEHLRAGAAAASGVVPKGTALNEAYSVAATVMDNNLTELYGQRAEQGASAPSWEGEEQRHYPLVAGDTPCRLSTGSNNNEWSQGQRQKQSRNKQPEAKRKASKRSISSNSLSSSAAARQSSTASAKQRRLFGQLRRKKPRYT
jgi:hypothetical protein